MRSSHSLDRLDVAFNDDRLMADAGLLLPATPARRLGLRGLVDGHVDLGDAPARANAGDKILTLVASALAGGDTIDDADALRVGGTAGVLGHAVKAASTLGTFLRSFRWGHVRQLDAVSRLLMIDLDSTICETYGLAEEGGSDFTYTHTRGYHSLLAVAASTGDVLHARLRRTRCRTPGHGPSCRRRSSRGTYRLFTLSGQTVRIGVTVRADPGVQSLGLPGPAPLLTDEEARRWRYNPSGARTVS